MEDHIIVVEGNATVPPTPPKSIDKRWSDFLRRRLNDSFDECWREEECSIFTVPHNLRLLDPNAYEPRVVSIGPYHRGKPRLQTMEKHKWRMARRLLSKCHDNKLEECLEKMMALENRVRSCYSEPIEMGSSEFAEMMFLDGCFILGVLLRQKFDVKHRSLTPMHEGGMPRGELLKLQSSMKRATDENVEGDDDGLKELFRAMVEAKQAMMDANSEVIKEELMKKMLILEREKKQDNWVWAACEGEEEPERGEIQNLLYALELVDLDLLKIENQMPFFIVEALFDLLLPPEGKNIPLLELAMHLLNKISQSQFYVRIGGNPKVHHLLHIFYIMLVADPKTSKPPTPPPWLVRPNKRPASQVAKNILPCFFQDSERKQELPWPSGTGWMLSATEQKEAGVVFKQKRQCSFIDVTFNNGVMEIPVLCIYENTFPIFRNLIAFEQCYPNTSDHITYYSLFMESMIKTPGDVKALQSEGILRIGKSNEVEVALLFNKLCTEVFVDNSMSYLSELVYKVNEHCGSKWNKWRAVLARNYFNNPWSIISLAAAILIIVLTFLQTYTSLYSYAHHAP
ncbi:UPF0481 protein [Acorus gramineus]|uniref:UPF0481 protein n=1 Tax=Acorus gramineus TaxID=55184 RepID=A0AAV9B865_ACOGR|nr:UPF0481 protein [Acorus gramineus]